VPTNFQAEIKAASAYIRLLQEAEECRRLYSEAAIALPEPLKRMLGDEKKVPGTGGKQLEFPTLLTKPDRGRATPPGVGEKWISIEAAHASPSTIALSIMRSLGEPIKAVQLALLVANYAPDSVQGTVFNMLTRNQTRGLVEETREGWKLIREEDGGILDGDYIWAHPKNLMQSDLALHRREAILLILRQHPNQTAMQITRSLQSWDWVQAPASKDLIKADLSVLETRGLIKRREDTRGWEIVNDQEAS
jgi:hypothetical protein